MPFQLTPSVSIGIKGYNLIIEEKLRPAKNFTTNAEKVVEVKPLTRWNCAVNNLLNFLLLLLKAYCDFYRILVKFLCQFI